ncbi:MAG: class I SAM-dependent methyltransferase [Planctomycetes bacterium]|nr:class I SAM-dependent methyltransferase [Planctomycetota bacterium]
MLQFDRRRIGCESCGSRFPYLHGTPVLLPDPNARPITHEGKLQRWEGYHACVTSLIDSLSPHHIVLDIGAGNRDISDERIIRLDVIKTPFVDVIGDAHRLPFRDGSIDVILASAVWEHLRNPFLAAQEVSRVLRPGGQVCVDCNFVFPFHGYPAVYFNCSKEGLRELFSGFDEIAAEVASWQKPSYAVEALLTEYLARFRYETPQELAFVNLIHDLGKYPIREFDRRFSEDDSARIAAGVTFLGLKPPSAADPVIGRPLLKHYSKSRELRAQFPNPHVLLNTVHPERFSTLLQWARKNSAAIIGFVEWEKGMKPFSRRLRAE